MLKPSDLKQFIGTEHWYRHPLVRAVLYTDGVKFFAEKAGAYWFLDILATEVYPLLKKEPFLLIRLIVQGHKAQILVDDGNDNQLWERDIEFTDCPEGEWWFYFTDNVILLPSEY